MGHVFYDIFLIIIVLLLRMKFYHGHHWQKYGLQNGSFPNDIGVLLLGDIKYTFKKCSKNLIMHILILSLIISINIIPEVCEYA